MSTTTPTRLGTAPSFALLRAQVVATRYVSPHMRRITFGGGELASMASGGLDQRIKLVLPQPGQAEPVFPEGERDFAALRALPDAVRPVLRTYTVREHRAEAHEFDVDFVAHGDGGPGTRFACGARVGDSVAVYVPHADYPHGPRFGGVEYRLDRLVGETLLVGDETALPAIAAILERLPADVRASVLLEVPEGADIQPLPSPADVEITWLARGGRERGAAVLEALLTQAMDDPYVWIAGESGMVVAARRHLVKDRGLDRRTITFMGYWRTGSTEETCGHVVRDRVSDERTASNG